MVLIDTCIWIDLYRKRNEAVGQLLFHLLARNEAALCGCVYVEFIGGFRNRKTREEYQKLMHSLPYLLDTRASHEKAALLLAEFPNLGLGDALIASIALTHKVPLFTRDTDYTPLKKQGLQIVNPTSF